MYSNVQKSGREEDKQTNKKKRKEIKEQLRKNLDEVKENPGMYTLTKSWKTDPGRQDFPAQHRSGTVLWCDGAKVLKPVKYNFSLPVELQKSEPQQVLKAGWTQ